MTYRKCPDPKGNRCFSYDNYVDTSIGNFDDETSEVFCYKRKEYDVVFLDGEVRDEFLYRMRKVMKKGHVFEIVGLSGRRVVLHGAWLKYTNPYVRGRAESRVPKYSDCSV